MIHSLIFCNPLPKRLLGGSWKSSFANCYHGLGDLAAARNAIREVMEEALKRPSGKRRVRVARSPAFVTDGTAIAEGVITRDRGASWQDLPFASELRSALGPRGSSEAVAFGPNYSQDGLVLIAFGWIHITWLAFVVMLVLSTATQYGSSSVTCARVSSSKH